MNTSYILLNLLFIIILIVLLFFYIYFNNSDYEKFNINGIQSPDNQNAINTASVASISNDIANESAMVGGNFSLPDITRLDDSLKDGRNYLRPLPSAEFGLYLVKLRMQNPKIPVNRFPSYENGYYWINIPFVGPQYIYCLMDEAYFGGGWMLAMRSIKNSRIFNFNSVFFNYDSVLNNNAEDIQQLINEINKPDDIEKISSIGDYIYTKTEVETTSSDISSKWDAKFHTFNYFPAREWMCIFYKTNNQRKIITGKGDLAGNPRGYVWYEKNVSYKSKLRSPLELFNFLDIQYNNDGRKNEHRRYNLRTFYANVRAENIKGKWISGNGQLTLDDYFFSGQRPGFNFYGINYRPITGDNNIQQRTKVRWGFAFNNVKDKETKDTLRNSLYSDESDETSNNAFGGIGLSYPGNDTMNPNLAFSCGDFRREVNRNPATKELDSRGAESDLTFKILEKFVSQSGPGNTIVGTNGSLAFEWYIR